MGTTSDAKTSGWGITWEQRVGRIITGQILWGSALGDCTKEEKQRAVVWDGMGREQRRHALRGESLWGRYNWGMRGGAGS